MKINKKQTFNLIIGILITTPFIFLFLGISVIGNYLICDNYAEASIEAYLNNYEILGNEFKDEYFYCIDKIEDSWSYKILDLIVKR